MSTNPTTPKPETVDYYERLARQYGTRKVIELLLGMIPCVELPTAFADPFDNAQGPEDMPE